LFDRQSAAYREEVLPSSVVARISIEAGSTWGWERYVGAGGLSFGIDHFGASAPGATNMKEAGFTPENVASEAERLVRSSA
jgi:transketolase